jgi:ubiquinone biosynthesis protein UbiJ
MVNAVLGQALCIPAELAINNILKHDAATIAALGRHQGRLLGITIVGVANVTVRLLDNDIQLGMSSDHVDTEVTLSGSMKDFIGLARAEDKASELINSNIDMDGDTELALAVTRIVQKLDIDWEAVISPVTGGVIAHQLGKGLRSMFGWGRTTSATYRQAGKDYLEDEARLITPEPLARQFSNDVDELRLATDRLSARIAQLQQQATNKE